MGSLDFQRLSAPDRRELLDSVVGVTGHPSQLFEKDIWVVQTLSVLFGSHFGADLVFKGGTSLSKAYRAIRRFSEDIDVTYDIRRFVPELVGDAGKEALPPTRSQERRWTRIIRPRLVEWTREEALPTLAEGMTADGWPAELRAEGDRVYVAYPVSCRKTSRDAARAHLLGESHGHPRVLPSRPSPRNTSLPPLARPGSTR